MRRALLLFAGLPLATLIAGCSDPEQAGTGIETSTLALQLADGSPAAYVRAIALSGSDSAGTLQADTLQADAQGRLTWNQDPRVPLTLQVEGYLQGALFDAATLADALAEAQGGASATLRLLPQAGLRLEPPHLFAPNADLSPADSALLAGWRTYSPRIRGTAWRAFLDTTDFSWRFSALPPGTHTLATHEGEYALELALDAADLAPLDSNGAPAESGAPSITPPPTSTPVPLTCGTTGGDPHVAIGSYCWSTVDDAQYHNGNSSADTLFAATDSVGFALEVRNSAVPWPYADARLRFGEGFALDLSRFGRLVLEADIPAGDTLNVRFIQTDITDWNWFEYELIGAGPASYAIPFADLTPVQSEGPTLPFNPALLEGINLRNSRVGSRMELKVYGVVFGS